MPPGLLIDRRITVDSIGIWQPVAYGKSYGTVQFSLCSCGFESLFQCQSQPLSSCFFQLGGVLGRFFPKVWARVPGEFWKVPGWLQEVFGKIQGRFLGWIGFRRVFLEVRGRFRRVFLEGFCGVPGKGSAFRKVLERIPGSEGSGRRFCAKEAAKMRNKLGFQHIAVAFGDITSGYIVDMLKGSLFVRMTLVY